jgi:hypothetical protein
MDLSIQSTSEKGLDLSAVLQEAQARLLQTIHKPHHHSSGDDTVLLSYQRAERFPHLAAAFDTARGPTLKRKRLLKSMSPEQRAKLKLALHEDVKTYLADATTEAFVTQKSIGTEPLPADALQCVAAIGAKIDDAEAQINVLRARVKMLEQAELAMERVAANALTINAYNASLDANEALFTMPPAVL